MAIKERCTNSKFGFSFLKKRDILKEIKNLQINKATQDSDIPNNFIKNNSDLFVDSIFTNLNDSIALSTFHSLLKLANITPVHKKTLKHQKNIIVQLVCYQIFSNFMRGLCSGICLNILSHSFQNFSAVLGKVLVPSSVSCQCLRNGNRELIIKTIWGTPYESLQDI